MQHLIGLRRLEENTLEARESATAAGMRARSKRDDQLVAYSRFHGDMVSLHQLLSDGCLLRIRLGLAELQRTQRSIRGP